MFQTELLKKIFQKATDNGWKAPTLDMQILTIHRSAGKHTALENWTNGLLLSHDFAKAFFGEERKMKGKWFVGETWQIHLRTMVLEEDRVAYLAKFL